MMLLERWVSGDGGETIALSNILMRAGDRNFTNFIEIKTVLSPGSVCTTLFLAEVSMANEGLLLDVATKNEIAFIRSCTIASEVKLLPMISSRVMSVRLPNEITFPSPNCPSSVTVLYAIMIPYKDGVQDLSSEVGQL